AGMKHWPQRTPRLATQHFRAWLCPEPGNDGYMKARNKEKKRRFKFDKTRDCGPSLYLFGSR
ncbi:MAG: hypothetical protein V5B78_11470, partial [Desulfohalobiaceae bacterium]